jgi:hypothetical protein
MRPIHAHDVLRARLFPERKPPSKFRIEDLARSEWSPQFEKYMRARMILGAFRYGLLHAKGKRAFDRVAYIQIKLREYGQTGNCEALVDIANLSLLEFEEGTHPKKHFAALDEPTTHCPINERK